VSDAETTDAKARGGDGRLLLLLLAGVAALFAWNVTRHAFLGDDAFISFRYARNLVDGHGLVWNPGERVEGYTNFLWVLLMAAALRLGLAPEIVSNALGVASGAGVVAALLVFSARRAGWRDPFVWLAPAALAASRSFTAWCSGGLETMTFTLLVLLGVLGFLRERARLAALPLASSLCFAAAALTRPEGVLFGSVVGLCFAADVARGRRSLRALVVWSLPMILLVGGHALWRHAYYGAWLPNTFVAKVPGLWWEQGARYLGLFASDHWLYPFLPLALLPLFLARDRSVAALFLALVSAQATYLLAIGGDRFEFRFVVFVLPYLYWLIAEGMRLGVERLPASGTRRVAAALGCAALLGATAFAGPHPSRAERHGVAPLESIAAYGAQREEEGRFLRSLVDAGLLPDDLLVAAKGAGALPYYTRWPAVDAGGLSDALVARAPIAPERGTVAHERDAPWDYLARRHVVVFDFMNRVVHDAAPPERLARVVAYQGQPVPVRVVRARGRYLVFGTFASDAEIRAIFGKLEILR
jgi:hypothetical protein